MAGSITEARRTGRKTVVAFCLMCYQNAWMKSRESFEGPRVTKLREEGSDERKLLLGAIPKW